MQNTGVESQSLWYFCIYSGVGKSRLDVTYRFLRRPLLYLRDAFGGSTTATTVFDLIFEIT